MVVVEEVVRGSIVDESEDTGRRWDDASGLGTVPSYFLSLELKAKNDRGKGANVTIPLWHVDECIGGFVEGRCASSSGEIEGFVAIEEIDDGNMSRLWTCSRCCTGSSGLEKLGEP